MSTTVKAFVVTHKEVKKIPEDRILIGVGSNKNIDGVAIYDDTLQNISAKNSSYCELTALYWMWKNGDGDYFSLEHYRRFFCKKGRLPFVKAKPQSVENFSKILSKYDVILPKKILMIRDMYTIYSKAHYGSDLNLCLEIIKKDCPEYEEDCKAIFKSHMASMRNMFVMSTSLMDEYCEWLFNILFQVEKQIDILDRDEYQKRVFGFLSERLFNVWLRHKNLKAYYAPIYGIDDIPFLCKLNGLWRRIKRLFKRK